MVYFMDFTFLEWLRRELITEVFMNLKSQMAGFCIGGCP